MKYDFLIESYETERVKGIDAWSMFRDGDLPVRPNASDPPGASAFASDARAWDHRRERLCQAPNHGGCYLPDDAALIAVCCTRARPVLVRPSVLVR
jgi:hypothetical protein